MKYALVKDGIVENIIEYDLAAIEAGQAEYNKAIAEHEKAEKAFDIEFIKYRNAQKAVRKEIKATAEYWEDDPEDIHGPGLTAEGELALKNGLDKIKAPFLRYAPKKPLDVYIPPEGVEMIEITGNCNIGWEYRNKKFHAPSNEA